MNIQVPVDKTKSGGKSGSGVRNLERLSVERYCGRIVVFHPSRQQVADLVEQARRDLPQITDLAVVRRVIAHNPDNFWAIQKKTSYVAGEPDAQGFVAMLLLNEAGVDALLTGRLDRSDPPSEFLVAQHEKPAGVYVWTLYAKGALAVAVSLVRDRICSPYERMDIFGRAVNDTADHFMQSLGYNKGLWWNGKFVPDFYHYRVDRRAALEELSDFDEKNLAPFDSYREGAEANADKRHIAITVAHNIEDLMRVMTVRAAVYIGEQECPYREEYDGNDFASTHLLGYVGDEPAGCLRIRFFAEFAKLERLAVRKEFRSTRLSARLVKAGIELCRNKGYRRLYGHSQKRLVNFWSRHGFRPLENAAEFVFSDFEYVEMVADIEPLPQAIAIGADPYVIIRPEGRWDRPGVLEYSIVREASSPSVAG
jgi:predicted GNAT family N-acyltransferase